MPLYDYRCQGYGQAAVAEADPYRYTPVGCERPGCAARLN